MTVIGIGMDIIEIRRVETVVSRSGDRLARRILSPEEWNQYQKHNQPIRFLAKRFAVKEATSKAFGIGIRSGLTFMQFQIIHDTLGKPSLQLSDRAAELAIQLGISATHVTLADERHYTCALVIFEC